MRGHIHDLANSLTAISGFAALGERAPFPRSQRLFGHIQTASRMATEILEQMRARARNIDAEACCDVNAAIGAQAAALIDTMGVEVSLSLAVLPPAAIPPLDFQRLLLNVVVNASEAMQAVARGEGATPPNIGFRSEWRGVMLAVSVRDSGPGMAADIVAKIRGGCEVTSKGEGHGCGLARIVWPTLMRCGGRLEVESAPGVGSEFTMLIPAAKEARLGEDPLPRQEEAAGTAAA